MVLSVATYIKRFPRPCGLHYLLTFARLGRVSVAARDHDSFSNGSFVALDNVVAAPSSCYLLVDTHPCCRYGLPSLTTRALPFGHYGLRALS